MRMSLRKRTKRFWRNEDGASSSIEFLFWFPLFFYVGYSGMDLGLQSFHHADLERSLDMTIREVRLNRLPAGEDKWDHALLKKMICERALISECSQHLALEMKSIDPRVGNTLDPTPFCVDTPATIRKAEDVVFELGTSNELMIIRACLEVSPAFGFSMMNDLVKQDNDGQWELHAISVFVHEPFGGSSNTATGDGSSTSTEDTTSATN